MPIHVIPQQLMFTNRMVLIFGSDVPPQLWDGVAAPAVIGNTFTAQYPVWQASVGWIIGDYVVPTVANAHYYRCVQGGVSAVGEPVWPVVTGTRVTDKQVIWEEAGLVSTSPAPPGAAHGIVYAGALWLLNTSPTNTASGIDGPSALRMSDVNNPGSWNPLNSAFVGKDDGSQGTGLATFTIAEIGITPVGSLVVFKEFKTYQAIGVFGSPNFSIQPVQTDMGCIAPRSIRFLPGFGIARLSHLGVALFDGVRDKLISEEIRPYLFSDKYRPDISALDWSRAYLSRGALCTNPPMYMMLIPTLADTDSGMRRILCYDLVLKAWAVMDLPWSVMSFEQIRASGTVPITIAGAFSNGTIQSLQEGAGTFQSYWTGGGDQYFFNQGLGPNWSVRTPLVFDPGMLKRPIYVHDLTIRGKCSSIGGSSTGSQASIALRVKVEIVLQSEDGLTYTNAQSFLLGADVIKDFELIVPIGEVAVNAYAVISPADTVFSRWQDLEFEGFVWQILPQPADVPAVVS